MIGLISSIWIASAFTISIVNSSTQPSNHAQVDKIPDWLTMFEDYYNNTVNFDVAKVLSTNYSKLIDLRDEIYLISNVTKDSTDEDRLEVIAAVVNFAFMTIDPRCTYTKSTDIKHFKEISYLSAHQWVDDFPDTKVPITLIIAGWFHDIERFIPETRRKSLVK